VTGAPRETTGALSAASRLVYGRRLAGIAAGTLAVAAAAQVAVPVPLSPVPMTLQPLAVLAVGGVLGAAGGVAALTAYLALGALGFPVFAGGAAGPLYLVGPTGGYLLAFPVAAGITGALASRGGVLRTLVACALGMVVIHVGGVAQLAVLGGNPSAAFRVGFVPFFTGDLLKVGLAAAVVLGLRSRTRPVN
jgi:biotin transport system substrate-specific component